jgi:putative SOS response-associated peptidase YedK
MSSLTLAAVERTMCGRTFQKTPLGEIRVLFGTVNATPNMAPNYNAAPTDILPIVRLDRDGRRSLDLLRWGLIPYWAKDASIGARCINAMAETVATKPAFREAFQRRRCLVPIDGFYEWQKPAAGPKQPYAIVSADGQPFAMAGLWERWRPSPDASPLQHLHDRHRATERTRRPDPQPDAGHPAACRLAPLAR